MSQQINLFNPVFLKQKKIFSAVNMLDAMAVLVVGVGAFYAYASIETLNLDRQSIETTRQYEQSKAQLAQTSAKYAPKKLDTELEAQVNKLQAQLDARKAMLDSLSIDLLAQDASYAEYLRALARQSLAGLWLTEFRVGKGGVDMEISGRALQPELVPAYIHGLEREPALRGRAFDSLTMTQRESPLPGLASGRAGAPGVAVRAPATPGAGAAAVFGYTEFRLGATRVAASAQVGAKPEGSPGPASARDVLAGSVKAASAADGGPR